MSDSLESKKQEVLRHAAFGTLAEVFGADTVEKRVELARTVAEAFSAGIIIETDREVVPTDGRTLPKGVTALEQFVRLQLEEAVTQQELPAPNVRPASAGTRTRAARIENPTSKAPPQSRAIAPPPEPCNIAWRQAEGRPESAVFLAELPPGVLFPDDFPEPVRFEAAQRQLRYRGFMSANSYHFLQVQSSDLSYMRALADLNTKSAMSLVQQPAGHSKRLWAALLAAAGIAAAAFAWFKPR